MLLSTLEMFLSPGARLDKYEIIAPLAVGGMAELYLARSLGIEGFEKVCVLKRILPQHARDEAFVKMFLDEARLAATLRHPNAIQVYDIGGTSGRYYFAMEYVHGQDLRAIVLAAQAQQRGLRVAHALTICAGVAAGLHHAHEQTGVDRAPLGIVHRDVSPTNILVSYDGHIKVVDFGIAKAATRATRTTGGGFKGKLSYMSPEQVLASPTLDRRSDVFSLGVILYELTTGKPLFRGESDFVIAERIVAGGFARPAEARPGYDARLEEIVMTALAREPGQRFATAEAFQLALEAFARDAQLALSSVSLASFMRGLFADKVDAWEQARTGGRSLSDHLRSTAEVTAIRVVPGEEPAAAAEPATIVAPSPRRSWWRRPSAVVAALGIIAAVAGWAVVLGRGSPDPAGAASPPPDAARPAAAAIADAPAPPAPVDSAPPPPPVSDARAVDGAPAPRDRGKRTHRDREREPAPDARSFDDTLNPFEDDDDEAP